MWGALSDGRTCLSFTIAAAPHQRSHSWVLVPRGSGQYFILSDSRLPQPGGPGLSIYINQEQNGPVISPDIGFPFRHLLRLAGLRWKYSNPPPHGQPMGSESESLRLAVYLQSVRLSAKHLEAQGQTVLQLNAWGNCPYIISSLSKGWICRLWIGFAFVKCTYRTYSIGLHGYEECFFFPGNIQSDKSDNLE
jgi:hypothetical protein